ncbi:MAG TPA: SDR family oxidoreductase [Candidatus Methylomirabilis sp.]|nr:SDR family oxidoreductase [Candidatus Methylomirabilis sp.]
MNLQDAVAVVTGGTGGLGRRICHAVARQGVQVAVCYDQRQEEAETVARGLRGFGGRAIPVGVDVTRPESVQGLVDRVVREFGRIDILVNDAAYNKWIPFPQLQDLQLEDWTKILRVNLTGPFACIRAVAPLMRRQGQGRIVNVSSMAGLSPTGSSIAYAVSKAALIHLTRCMAVALAPDVLVNCVAPGFMEGTRMSQNLSPEYRQKARQSALLQRGVDKDDVAEMVVEFCRTDSITGQTLVMDAGRVFH